MTRSPGSNGKEPGIELFPLRHEGNPKHVSDGGEVRFEYVRRGAQLSVTILNLAAWELGELIVGLWARFQPDSRAEMIAELDEYAAALDRSHAQPEQILSPVALAVGSAADGETLLDLPTPPR